MTRRNCSLFLVLLGFSVFGALTARAAEELRVTLFEQPCSMTGPYPRTVLQNIHDISPEKTPPEMSIEAMKRVRNRANALKGVHPLIETYRDHLRKRLSAKIAFEEALLQAKKKERAVQKLEVVLANVREHIPPAAVSGFESLNRLTIEKNAGAWDESFVVGLRERYEGAILANPEEEFHKAIRAAKVQYVCAFDDGAEDDDDFEEDAPANEVTPMASPSPSLSVSPSPSPTSAPVKK